jgi:hypothetical protein
MIFHLGIQEILFVIIVGLIVGFCFGARLKYDQAEISAMLVTQAFYCAFVGAIILLVGILITYPIRFNDDDVTFAILFFAPMIGGGFSFLFSTPIAFAIWRIMSHWRIRRGRINELDPD